MTDPELVAKKLAFILARLEELATAKPDALATDVRERYFVEHALQLAIQAAIDVALHIVSDRRIGEPQTNRELFGLLARGGFVEPPLATTLGAMAGFRNVLVHEYADVDLAIVRDVLENRLGDLRAFVTSIREHLP